MSTKLQFLLSKASLVIVITEAATGGGGRDLHFYSWNAACTNAVLIGSQNITAGDILAAQATREGSHTDATLMAGIASPGPACGFLVADLKRHKTTWAWMLAS